MMRRLLIHPLAEQDLRSCVMYLAQDGARVAQRFTASIAQACEYLLEFPGAGAPAHFNPDAPKLRRWNVPGFRSYLILYIADDETVSISRILHGARDLKGALAELDAWDLPGSFDAE